MEDKLLDEKLVDEVKKAHEKRVIDESELSEEDQETFAKMLEEAKMPVKFTDDKFKLGENELDVRELSAKNYKQMMYRVGVLENVYLKQTVASLPDIIRLQMLILKKLGTKDIVKEIDELETELKNLIN